MRPNIYHEMRWKFDPSFSALCRSKHPNLATYTICIKSQLKKPKKARFTEKEDGTLEFNNFVGEVNDKEIPPLIGYQHVCKGDSGSGHWVKNDLSDVNRFVLVGITAVGPELCGRSSHMQTVLDKDVDKFIRDSTA